MFRLVPAHKHRYPLFSVSSDFSVIKYWLFLLIRLFRTWYYYMYLHIGHLLCYYPVWINLRFFKILVLLQCWTGSCAEDSLLVKTSSSSWLSNMYPIYFHKWMALFARYTPEISPFEGLLGLTLVNNIKNKCHRLQGLSNSIFHRI